jgi:hypothetical protein
VCKRCAAANYSYQPPSNFSGTLTIASFQNGSAMPFLANGWSYTSSSVLGYAGRAVLLPVGRYLDAWDYTGLPTDWSKYDILRVDVWNPASVGQSFYVELRDSQTVDYWTRVNWFVYKLYNCFL